MKKFNWRLLTKIIIFVLTTIFIVYDIIVYNLSPSDTLSDVMRMWIWKFPFVIFAWQVLAGHFTSPIKTKDVYPDALACAAALMFAFSLIIYMRPQIMNGIILTIVNALGFATGALLWGRRRK